MAGALSNDRLLAALRAEGCRVVERAGWRTRRRPASTGSFGPINGVMIHHTVTSGTVSSVELCEEGHSTLPGPLCHGVIAKDGTVYLISNGRANHAGRGDSTVLGKVQAESYARDSLLRPGRADADGNRRFYGFECVNLGNGRDPWPAAQRDAIVRATAAILRAYGGPAKGWTGRSAIGHLEWQPGKIDPRTGAGGVDVAPPVLRRLVDERLAHSASWSPGGSTPPTQEDNDMPETLGLYDPDNRTLPPGTWLRIPVERNDLLTDAKAYDLTVHVDVACPSANPADPDLTPPCGTVQGRFVHVRPDGSEWKSVVLERPCTPGTTFADFRHSGSIRPDEAVRFEVIYYPDRAGDTEPATIVNRRARGLYWK